MYIFINKGLRMSPGKIAAQAGHAALEAGLISNGVTAGGITAEAAALWDEWRKGLHYAKYVMEARDRDHLLDIERYLKERGFRTVLIIDEGHTEIDPITPTALGVALVDKDDPHTAAIFSSFKLYKEPRPGADLKKPGFLESLLTGR
jgi:peptidyl-tRNA hydrolase